MPFNMTTAADATTPDAYQGLKFPAPAKHLHEQIALAASRTPRFLLRLWHKTSGGDQSGCLNSKDAITPHAFLDGKGPKSIYDVPKKYLVDMANGHYRAHMVDTSYSSWTSSLTFVMSLILQKKGQAYSGSHISILDTSKLPSNVTILFPPAMRILDKTTPTATTNSCPSASSADPAT